MPTCYNILTSKQSFGVVVELDFETFWGKKLMALLVLVNERGDSVPKKSNSTIRHLKDPVSRQLEVARAPLPIFARLYNKCKDRARVKHGFRPRKNQRACRIMFFFSGILCQSVASKAACTSN